MELRLLVVPVWIQQEVKQQVVELFKKTEYSTLVSYNLLQALKAH